MNITHSDSQVLVKLCQALQEFFSQYLSQDPLQTSDFL